MIEQLGPYKIERVLGRGGMGTVYVGVDPESEKLVAVKALSPAFAADAHFRERFGAEVESLRRLKHPNIVELYGYGEQDGVLFYVMELVEGRNLHEELLTGRKFTWREVVQIGIQTSLALKHAHDHGVIHRDLKPANLILSSSTQQVKLSDFGIAKLFGATQLTADGGVIGTADFMSPEQAEGKKVTNRCDIYSLGSVLYTLLARRPPFLGRTLPEVVHSLRFDTPEPVNRHAPHTPPQLAELISQMLEKDPADRIPTVLAVSKRLASLQDLEFDAPEDGFRTKVEPTSGKPTRLNENVLPQASTSAEVTEVSRNDSHVERGSLEETSVSEVPKSGGSLQGKQKRLADRYTPVTAEQRKTWRPAGEQPPGPAHWARAVGMALLLMAVVAALVFALRPPSADALYKKISAAAGEGAEGLRQAEEQINQFLQQFPEDSRAEEVRRWSEQLDLYDRNTKYRRWVERGIQPPDIEPIETLYLAALRKLETDPRAAAAELQGLIGLWADAEETTVAYAVRNLAQKQLSKLQSHLDRQRGQAQELLSERMQRAEELSASDLPSARAIWEGIITLYSDKPWASETVQLCREKLKETAAGEGD